MRWGDAEDETEEPLGWDFSDLRRRSSVFSGALQAARDNRVSALQPGQPGGGFSESLGRPTLNLSNHHSLGGRKKRT